MTPRSRPWCFRPRAGVESPARRIRRVTTPIFTGGAKTHPPCSHLMAPLMATKCGGASRAKLRRRHRAQQQLERHRCRHFGGKEQGDVIGESRRGMRSARSAISLGTAALPGRSHYSRAEEEVARRNLGSVALSLPLPHSLSLSLAGEELCPR